jgi:superfamily II DNA or RNA helicase
MSNVPKILTSQGYTVLKSSLSNERIKEIENALTMNPRTMAAIKGLGKEPFPIYMESNTRLYLPRAWGLKELGPPDADITPEGADLPKSITFNGLPRDYQIPIIEKFMKAGANGLICVPCGRGKTFMAINIALRLGKRFLIVVDKEFLLEQWRGELTTCAPGIRVGILQAAKAEVAADRFDCTICMIQTLCSRDYPKGYFDDYGFTVFDECHKLGAAHFSKSLQKIQTKRILGLSATPDREDGMAKVFEAYIGKPVYQEKVREPDPTVIVRAVYYPGADADWADVPTDWKGDVVLPTLLKKLTTSTHRSSIIVGLLKELCEEKSRQILVLSDHKSLLEIVEGGLPNTLKVGYYIGGMKKGDLADNAANCQVLLATYAMASDALNIPSLNCVVLASPRKRVEQSTGRILRQKIEDRTLAPVIVDIVDVHDTYRRMYKKREEYYKKCHYEIKSEGPGAPKPVNDIIEPKVDTSKSMFVRRK